MDEVIGGTWHNAQSVDLHVRGRIRSAVACQAGCCRRSVGRTELSAGAAGKRTPSRIGGRQAVGGFGMGACSERRHDSGGLAATQRAVHGAQPTGFSCACVPAREQTDATHRVYISIYIHIYTYVLLHACEQKFVRSSVVLMTPSDAPAAPVDTVILSQPLPSPIHPPHSWTCVSPGGGASLPTPLNPRSTLTTPSNTSPARQAISSPTTRLGS